jgi:hypothetical protein
MLMKCVMCLLFSTSFFQALINNWKDDTAQHRIGRDSDDICCWIQWGTLIQCPSGLEVWWCGITYIENYFIVSGHEPLHVIHLVFHDICYDCLLNSHYVFSLSLSASLIAFTLSLLCIIDLERLRVSFHVADGPTFPYLYSDLFLSLSRPSDSWWHGTSSAICHHSSSDSWWRLCFIIHLSCMITPLQLLTHPYCGWRVPSLRFHRVPSH